MGDFTGVSLSEITELTPEAADLLERQLSAEFKNTAKDFMRARLGRLSHNLHLLRNTIGYITKQEAQWTQKQALETQAVHTLMCEAETMAAKANNSGYDARLAHSGAMGPRLQKLIDGQVSPSRFDALLGGEEMPPMPFALDFTRIISPVQADLAAIHQDNAYQERLIRSLTQKEVEILWQQYRQDLYDAKNNMINETYERLFNLEREYYELAPARVRNSKLDHYGRSVVPVTSIKRHHDELVSKNELADPTHRQELSPYEQDSHYGVASRFLRNNRIEITNARREAIASVELARDAFGSSFVSGDFQLTSEEVDDDIATIRKKIKTTQDATSAPELNMPLPVEEETPVPEESIEEKYKMLLNMEVKSQYAYSQEAPQTQVFESSRPYHTSPPSSQVSEPSGKHVMPTMPPLDWFQSHNAHELRFRQPMTLNGPAN